jgi:hypothetical protein
MLAASAELDRSLYGPAVGIKEDDAGQIVVAGEQTRRSLYVRVRRSQPVAMLQAFDAPVMVTNCESRTVSTVATQSLMLMNGEFILKQAQRLAALARAEVKHDSLASAQTAQVDSSSAVSAEITRAWELALCRRPSRRELDLATEFLSGQLATMRSAKTKLPDDVSIVEQALTNVCQALLSSNEFMYVD